MKVDEVLHWLERAGEDLTLVGGQAVALWEHLLGLPVLTETVDIDFLGDAAQAQELADALGYDCRIPDSVDPTPNTAILVDDAGVVVGVTAYSEENYPRQLQRVRSKRERFARFLDSRR